jgi:tetratricopeptide (TPR) repeat protein
MRNRAVQFARERFKISDVADRFSTIIRVAGDPKRQNRERRLAQLNAESLRLMERREYQAAMRQLQKALELDPVYPATHYNVGLLYLETGNPGIALDSFIKVLEQDPSDSDAVLKCGAILRANNLEGHARRLYSIYLRQHPNDRKVRQMAGHS